MSIEKIINELSEKYYELGYSIKEICLPVEFKRELCMEKNLNEIDITQTDYSIIKLFKNDSKHFNIIIEPIREQ